MKVIALAKDYCCITDKEISLIKQEQEPSLFHDGAFESRKIIILTWLCELVGIFLLYSLRHHNNVGLYSDDRLMAVRNKSPKDFKKIREELHKKFF